MEPHFNSKWGHSYRSWHIPLTEDRIKLNDAVCDMHAMSHGANDIPLIVKLVENPNFKLPGFELFHGAVTLLDHDCIHILLGRGMLPKDEAFVIGFTMGSTGKVGCLEEKLYTMISHYLYPDVYKFKKDDLEVFRDGLHLGMSSHCKPLDQINYRRYMNETLGTVRQKLGINTDLLSAYYSIEAERFSYARESRRLVH